MSASHGFVESLATTSFILNTQSHNSPWPLRAKPEAGSLSMLILQALGKPFTQALVEGRIPEDQTAVDVLERIGGGDVGFVELEDDLVSKSLRTAKELFTAERTGLALRTEALPTRGSRIVHEVHIFPAVQTKGISHRLLKGPLQLDLLDLRKALDLLTLPSQVQAEGDNAYAITQLIDQAERPITISEQDMEDWVKRIGEAKLDVKMDIYKAHEDRHLENFIRYAGRLNWCDGDIMSAPPLTPEQAEARSGEWRTALEPLIRQ